MYHHHLGASAEKQLAVN